MSKQSIVVRFSLLAVTYLVLCNLALFAGHQLVGIGLGIITAGCGGAALWASYTRGRQANTPAIPQTGPSH